MLHCGAGQFMALQGCARCRAEAAAAAGNGWCRQHAMQSTAQHCKQCLVQAVPDTGQYMVQRVSNAQ